MPSTPVGNGSEVRCFCALYWKDLLIDLEDRPAVGIKGDQALPSPKETFLPKEMTAKTVKQCVQLLPIDGLSEQTSKFYHHLVVV